MLSMLNDKKFHVELKNEISLPHGQEPKKILGQLQQNADITNAELAARSDISASSCLRRVQRLKESGVIERTVSLCEGSKLGRDLTAMVEVFF